MQESHALPFELTSESVGDWLQSIDRLFAPEKVKLLSGVLSDLAHAQIEKNTLFLMLDRLTENVLLLSKLLEHNAQRLDYSPDKVRKWMSAAMQLPKKLSSAYAQLAYQDALDDTQKAVCVYRAMQILSLLNKRSCLFHEAPESGIWKKIAELYLLAEAKQWLTLAIDNPVSGLITLPTIETVVKHALLFQSCHPCQYVTSDITAIFAVTADLAPTLHLSPEASDFSLCNWQPDVDALPPTEFTESENAQGRILSLDAGDLIDFFENHPGKQAEFVAYPGLLNRLTVYYEIRRSVDPLHSKTCGLIIGNVQAEKFLNILISRYRVMELSGMNQSHKNASHLELVPLEIRNTLASLSSKILADVKNVSASQLTVFPTKDPAFWVTKIAHLKCSQDEPAILVQEGKPPCLSLIRHIRPDSNIKFKNLLLERIEGEVYPVEIGKNRGFIIVRRDSERAELFLPPNSRHRNTTVLAIDRGIIDAALKIEKFVELNIHFARYEVSFVEQG
jgi:hypothetical protein